MIYIPCDNGETMSQRPDMHAVTERAKLIRDRLIAYRITRDPRLIVSARARLSATVEQTREPEWWALEWLNILERPVQDAASFVRSKDEYSRRLSSCSPFSDEITGLRLSDDSRRRKLLSKAMRSVMLRPA